jgi:hypothetical protein
MWRKREIMKKHNEDDDIQEYIQPWVGLTDEEIKLSGFAVPFDGKKDWSLRFARVIEAKLKEKNT